MHTHIQSPGRYLQYIRACCERDDLAGEILRVKGKVKSGYARTNVLTVVVVLPPKHCHLIEDSQASWIDPRVISCIYRQMSG